MNEKERKKGVMAAQRRLIIWNDTQYSSVKFVSSSDCTVAASEIKKYTE